MCGGSYDIPPCWHGLFCNVSWLKIRNWNISQCAQCMAQFFKCLPHLPSEAIGPWPGIENQSNISLVAYLRNDLSIRFSIVRFNYYQNQKLFSWKLPNWVCLNFDGLSSCFALALPTRLRKLTNLDRADTNQTTGKPKSGVLRSSHIGRGSKTTAL